MLHCQVGSTAGRGNSLRHCLTVNLLVQPVDDCTVGEDYTYVCIQTDGGNKCAKTQTCALHRHSLWGATTLQLISLVTAS